jgi:putative flavoprotein involved in K+ transport
MMSSTDTAKLALHGASAQIAVVGAGPSGLATAACLKRAGLEPLVLERADRLGQQWRSHYDRLRLHTARALSGLPGLRLPRSKGPWVSRDDMAAYLETYAQRHALDVRTGVTVTSLARAEPDSWLVKNDSGDLHARFVVVAAGYNRRVHVPAWRGMATFRGRLLHSSEYRNAGPFGGRDVLVVGTGNSGSEIAVDLVEGGARQVFLSVRTPPNIIPRDLFGVPMQVPGVALSVLPPRIGDPVVRLVQRVFVPDLRADGLPRSRRGVATQFAAGDTVPVLDVGLVGAVRAHRVTAVAAVAGFSEDAVELADGTRLVVDAVIAATGYRRALEELVGDLGALDAQGIPTAHGAALPTVPNLYFVGYHPTIGGHLREINRESARTARAIAKTVAQESPSSA